MINFAQKSAVPLVSMSVCMYTCLHACTNKNYVGVCACLINRTLIRCIWIHFIIIMFTGSFIEFLIGGLTYPDESVKSAVVYILTQVCSNTPPNCLSLALMQNISRHVSTNLANSKSKELTANLLGMISADKQNLFDEMSLLVCI